MPKPLSPICHHLIEHLAPLGPVSARGMFGSTGLFCSGLMFAIVTPDEGVYIKADDQSREAFTAAGCTPFTYQSNKGEIALSYYRLPDADLESEDALLRWARSGLAAAHRRSHKRPGKSLDEADPWRSLIL